jgi:hypothetical protein
MRSRIWVAIASLSLFGCMQNETVVHSLKREKELVQIVTLGQYTGPYDVYFITRELGGGIKSKKKISALNVDMAYDTKKYIYDVEIHQKKVIITVCSFEYIDAAAVKDLLASDVLFKLIGPDQSCNG